LHSVEDIIIGSGLPSEYFKQFLYEQANDMPPSFQIIEELSAMNQSMDGSDIDSHMSNVSQKVDDTVTVLNDNHIIVNTENESINNNNTNNSIINYPLYSFIQIASFGRATDEAIIDKKYSVYFVVVVSIQNSINEDCIYITVYRRYSQFEILREKLIESGYKNVPSLPRKTVARNSQDSGFLTKRKMALDQWLHEVEKSLPNVNENPYYKGFLREEANDAPKDFQIMSDDTTEDEYYSTYQIRHGESVDIRSKSISFNMNKNIPKPPVFNLPTNVHLDFHFEQIFSFGTALDEIATERKYNVFYMLRVRIESANGECTWITVYRRYSQFEILREKLIESGYKNVPSLPRKTVVRNSLDSGFLTKRKMALDQWLHEVEKSLPNVNENPYYKGFLQEEANDAPVDFHVTC
jgi:hypothetical protein